MRAQTFALLLLASAAAPLAAQIPTPPAAPADGPEDAKLKALEPQFREVAEEAKARKKAVGTRGYEPKKAQGATA